MFDMHSLMAQADHPLLPWSPEQVFSFASNLALPGWILLAFFPMWRWTQRIVHAGILPAMLAVIYIAILIPPLWDGGMNFGDFGSLDGVMGLFAQPWAVVGGWVHYLAFDLYIGAWQVRDSNRVFTWPMSQLLVLPCLFLTLMLGPVGLLAYFLVRWTAGKTFLVE